MGKIKLIIAICILIAGLFGYVIGKNSIRIVPTTSAQLNLSYEQVKLSGIVTAKQNITSLALHPGLPKNLT